MQFADYVVVDHGHKNSCGHSHVTFKMTAVPAPSASGSDATALEVKDEKFHGVPEPREGGAQVWHPEPHPSDPPLKKLRFSEAPADALVYRSKAATAAASRDGAADAVGMGLRKLVQIVDNFSRDIQTAQQHTEAMQGFCAEAKVLYDSGTPEWRSSPEGRDALQKVPQLGQALRTSERWSSEAATQLAAYQQALAQCPTETQVALREPT